MARNITVSFNGIPKIQGIPALNCVRISGGEALGELFTYVLELKTPDTDNFAAGPAANLDLRGVLGQECSVSIDLDGVGTREINALITRARIKKAEGRHIVYELTLRPWLWLATKTTDFKVFQEKNVVEIIDDVLDDYAFPVEKRLCTEYPVREYQVQYGETDYQFLQRLMQEWGIYWFFEHHEGKHRLVLCDNESAHKPFTNPVPHILRYHPEEERLDEERVDQFDAAESLTSGVWISSDYDFTKPHADLTSISAQPRNTAHAQAEVYEWPGDYTVPDEGEARARIRMEEQRMTGSRCHGQGNARTIVPGCVFTLIEHPHVAANREYLVLSAFLELEDVAEESGLQQYRSHVRFEVQPAAEPFRLPRTISKPHTRGPQTAVVTGPAGQEIWTDQYGRVKVQFHWDRYGKTDEKTSCWVRVSYPWAGNKFGAVYIPRIGHEVVVDFLSGDPDQPLITGCVYNASNLPPWTLPDNATQSGILTRSSKDGTEANANTLRFEDKKGEEELWLHAEKDQRIEVENDESHWVGNDRSKNVDHDETVTIGNNRTETVGANETESIGRSRFKKVALMEIDSIGVNWTVAVGGLKAEAVGGACTQEVGLFKQCGVGQYYSLQVGASMNTAVGKNCETSIGGKSITVVKESMSTSVEQDMAVAVKQNLSLASEKDTVITSKAQLVVEAAEVLELLCGKSILRMDKDGTITLNGKELTLAADNTLQVSGNPINLN